MKRKLQNPKDLLMSVKGFLQQAFQILLILLLCKVCSMILLLRRWQIKLQRILHLTGWLSSYRKVRSTRFHSNPSIQTSDGLAPTLLQSSNQTSDGFAPTQQPNKAKGWSHPQNAGWSQPNPRNPQPNTRLVDKMCADRKQLWTRCLDQHQPRRL